MRRKFNTPEDRARAKKEYARAYYLKHRDEIIQATRERYKTLGKMPRNEYLASVRKHSSAHERSLTNGRIWRKNNREKKRAANAAWAKSNPEKQRAAVRSWVERNKDRKRETTRAWQLAHPENLRAASSKWSKKNPAAVKANNHRYRARLTDAGGNYTKQDVIDCLVMQGYRCFYCLASLIDVFHVDHMMPLSRGGSNGADNIVCACEWCNCSKGAKTVAEFILGVDRVDL
jgi:hypothetical protein